MNSITLTLPFPPSTNRLYMRNKAGGVFKAPKYALFCESVIEAARAQTNEKDWPIFGRSPVIISVDCYMPQTNRDRGNTDKALEDSLQGIVYVNDIQIIASCYYRYEAKKPKRKNARVVITIYPKT